MDKKTISGIVLTLLLVGILTWRFSIQTANAVPITLTVDDDGPADFSTIQDAINAANPGDTILVYNGTYYEHITINQNNVTLVGENVNGAIIDGSGNGRLIRVAADHVTIMNFTLQNGEYGTWHYYSNHCTISQNKITSQHSGALVLYGSNFNRIFNNTVSDSYNGIYIYRESKSNIIDGNMASDNSMKGIVVLSSDNCTITSNTVSYNNETGFYMNNSSDSLIRKNVVRYNSNIGIHVVDSSDNNTITLNTASNNGRDGIYLRSSMFNAVAENIALNNSRNGFVLLWADNNIVTGNTASNNTESGIEINNGTNNILSGNIASNDKQGLHLMYNATSNIMKENTAQENLIGILIMFSDANTIYRNNFLNNTYQVASLNSTNIWDSGVEGNHWSNYTGEDLDGDGIGDTLLPHQGVDWYPLVESWSPTRAFNATKDAETYQIKTLSNSTIASFQYNSTLNEISFNATGPTGTAGFCNMTIPKELGDTFQVLVDGVPVSYSQTENTTHYFLYFTYLHSTHIISVVIDPSPSRLVEKLIEDVEQMNLQQGIDNSLDAKLEATLGALEALNADKRNDAINKLDAFINEVEAQRGKKLTNEQADYLATEAQKIIDLIQG